MNSKVEQAMDFVIENWVDKPGVKNKDHDYTVLNITKNLEERCFEIEIEIEFSAYYYYDIDPASSYPISEDQALRKYPYEDFDGEYLKEETNLDFDFRVDTIDLYADVDDAKCRNYEHSYGSYYEPPETDYDMDGFIYISSYIQITILDED